MAYTECTTIHRIDGDYEYTLADGGATITRYRGDAHEPVIPADFDGNRVVAIGDSAFESCFLLTSIAILQGVTRIGESAFEGCIYLREVNLPGYVEHFDFDRVFGYRYMDLSRIRFTFPRGSEMERLYIKKFGNGGYAYSDDD